jgi:hypothetical protein
VQQTLDQNTPVTPDAATPADEAPAPCRACGAAMQPGQDWCLSCGTAAPGRLGGRPGWKTVNSVAALTLVLITGAVAASYAALSGDASSKAGQAPPAAATPVPGAVAQLPDAPPVASTEATPTVTTPAAKKPKAPAAPVTPVTPVTPVIPSFDEGTGDTGSTDTGGDTSTDTGGDTSTDTGGDTSTGDGTTTDDKTPSTPALTPIEIASDDLTSYDPSGRIAKSGDPGNAADGVKTTAWSVTTPEDGYPMQVGLLVDLGKAKSVAEVQLGTTTPGGRVEVYGATGSALPPDILDTRWEHVASRAKVDQTDVAGNKKDDGSEQINLLRGGGKFRYVLLWFTDAPKAGPTVRITEVGLKG